MRMDSVGISEKAAKRARVALADKASAVGGKTLKKRGARQGPVALLSEHFESWQRPVAISYFNPAAKEVFLAGTFNDWDPKKTKMVKQSDGQWTAQLTLKPASYEYRLIVDGVWQEHPMAQRFVGNPFGGLNSVLVVKD